MNNLIRGFLDGLRDRLIASVASVIGSTFSTFRTIQHAEQQSLLEDIARKYEADGKTQLAEQVRSQAANLTLDDPGTEARIVFKNVLEDQNATLAIDHNTSPQSSLPNAPGSKPAKKRRKAKPAKTLDDLDTSLD